MGILNFLKKKEKFIPTKGIVLLGYSCRLTGRWYVDEGTLFLELEFPYGKIVFERESYFHEVFSCND